MTFLEKIVSTGKSSQRVDIVFVAEGYTESEREKFLSDARIFADYILSSSKNIGRLNDPFSKYAKYFNVSALFVASAESGTDQPSKGIFVDTYFNSTQYGSDGRLNYGDQTKLNLVLEQALPENAREISVVLINSSVYGGAGGSSAWVTSGDIASAEVMLHEMGHSFASLEDEYVDPALQDIYPLHLLDSVHITNLISSIPWSSWMGYKDELGVVGVYEGGYYRSDGVWRATQTSKMLLLGEPFSAPQKEAFVLAFYDKISDYLEIQSDIPGLIKASVPDDEILRFSWFVNNQAAGENTAFFDAYGSGFYRNGNVIAINTVDSSGYVRSDLKKTEQQDVIQLKNVNVSDINQKSYVINDSNALIRADAQNNHIQLGAKAYKNYIDGGSGVDTLVLAASSSDYYLKQLGSGAYLFMQEGQAVMAAINVERVDFSEKIIWIGDALPITLQGTSGKDEFSVALAGDGIDGLDDIDVVTLPGRQNLFSVTFLKNNEWAISSAQGSDTLRNIERLKFDDGAVALDIQGHGGQAYRLYQAAFDRTPDKAGLGYWINHLDNGGSLLDSAAGFIASPEFHKIYGENPNSSELVTRFYQNVLHREPEVEGFDYWVNQLNTGVQTVPMVLSSFSESAENQANLIGTLINGFEYIPWM